MMVTMRNERGDCVPSQPEDKKSKKSIHGHNDPVTIALASVALLGAGVCITIVTNNSLSSIDRRVEETYPPTGASFEEFERARHEILIFDEKAHDQMLANGPLTNSILSDEQKLQKYRDAIKLVAEEETVYQKREELRKKLTDNKSSLRKIGEGIGVAVASLSMAVGFSGLFLLGPSLTIEMDKEGK